MLNLKEWRMFIAIPLETNTHPGEVFAHPELFHVIDVDWDTAEKIGKSSFSSDAMDTTDEYPIEPGEDPSFTANQVDALLKSLEKWRSCLHEEEKHSFKIVESALQEAKERNVGIYFKF